MAADDNFDASLTAARLVSADERYALVMALFPLLEHKHRDWLGYELHMEMTGTGERFSLTSADSHGLFLDRVIEPEVPALCDGLKAVLERKQPFVFEPLDERDFRLEVRPEGSDALVKLQYAYKNAPDDFGWPGGSIVSRESLMSFASQLRGALDRVQRSYV